MTPEITATRQSQNGAHLPGAVKSSPLSPDFSDHTLASQHGAPWGHIDTIREILRAKEKSAMTYHEYLKAVNEAAYAALRRGLSDARDVSALRQIAAATDALVDQNAPRALGNAQ